MWKVALKPQPARSRSKEWRNKVKMLDPAKYEQLKQKDRERKQNERRAIKANGPPYDRATRNKVKRQKELHREAVKRYRAKRREEKMKSSQPTPESSPAATSTSTETSVQLPVICASASRTAYNTKYQQSRRAAFSRQKKLAEKKKDRERKKISPVNVVRPGSSMYSPSSIKRAAMKVKARLPQSPRKLAEVMTKVVSVLSPRKKKLLSEKSFSKDAKFNQMSTNCLKQLISKLKKYKTNAARPARLATMASVAMVMKKYRLAKVASCILGARYKTIMSTSEVENELHVNKMKRKSRKCETFHQREQLVLDFYINSPHVRELPLKKKVTKAADGENAGNLQPGYVLDVTLHKLYQEYKEQYPTAPVGFTKFASLRPSKIRLRRKTDLITCECVYCVNVDNKLETIKHNSPKELAAIDKYSLVDKVLCKKNAACTFHRKACLDKSCDRCKDYKGTIVKIFTPFIDQAGEKLCNWYHWVRRPVSYKCKDGSMKTNVRRVLEMQTGSAIDLVDGLADDYTKTGQGGSTFPMHLFTARWQYLQVNQMKENLPPNSLITILDFAQNWTVQYQREIKSAFYSKEQLTIHPIVCYYKDPELNIQVRESVVFLSDDLNHDFYAVLAFMKELNKYLKDVRKLTIDTEYRFTDGCGAQYKSIGPFLVLGNSESELGCKVVHSYFGSEHGKYESDGENAVTKSGAERAIISGRVIIRNGPEMLKFCEENLAIAEGKSRRTFMLVNEIARNGYDQASYKTVTGTRSLHSIKSTGDPKEIMTRNLTCACPPCLADAPEKCENQAYVDCWKTVTLKQKASAQSGDADNTMELEGNCQSNGDKATSKEQPAATLTVEAEQQHEESIETGRYVAVKAGRSKWYAGRILKVDCANGEAEVDYLKKAAGSSWNTKVRYFYWPSDEERDIAWTPLKKMFLIPYPDIKARGDRSGYNWSQAVMAKIDSKLKKMD